jgi:F420-dependent oxidoreductase-like protein
MGIGIIVPQGWTGEYDGWDPSRAWARTVAVAQRAEALGFQSIWVYDHFHTTPEPTDEITFESFTTLSALAASTAGVRLGHIVCCAAYRNPALLAKMIGTMDVISGGRMEIGLGAGWKEDEWKAYGYGFPSTADRLSILEDALQIVSRLTSDGRATHEGSFTTVRDAINVPSSVQQPRPPIMVGGNGRNRTWRLAARFADELNLDAVPPAEIPEAMAIIADRCREVDRDPASLRVSVHVWLRDRDWLARTGEAAMALTDLISRYREHGVSRLMALVPGSADSDEALERFAEEAVSAGWSLGDTAG